VAKDHQPGGAVRETADQAGWLLTVARAGNGEAFAELTAPFRHELQVHCYRILGSAADAEDMLQETMTAAWRGLARFEERSSVRTWLHSIAANKCLNHLRATRGAPLRVVSFRHGSQPTRLIPTRANGQPAFGRYLRDPHAPVGHAQGLIVLTLGGDRISAVTGFNDTSVLARFGLPRTLPD
jgi:Sigma-70 region 2